MIVSCESCKSRYKLDDSKVSGRGAKITCPRCKHVFVVYAPAADTPAVASPNLAGKPPPVADDEEPTRIGAALGGRSASSPVSSVHFGGGAGMPMAPSMPVGRANPTLAVPLPEPAAPPTHVVGGSGPPSPPPGPTVTPGDANARAAALDFRKVGVPTWKVKVRIGLIYDFSDIKTLRKYITDGRVTPADVISHDGKTWKPIGEIPDLDTFFLDTYERLLRERGAALSPEPRVVDGAPSGPVAPAPTGEPEPTQFRDPFDDLKTRQRDRLNTRRGPGAGAATAGKEGGSRWGLYLGGIVILVLGGAGVWVATQHLQGTTRAPTVQTEAARPVRDQQREEIRKNIEAQFVPVVPDTPTDDVGAQVPLDPVATDPGVKVLDDGRIVRVREPSARPPSEAGTSRSAGPSTSTAAPIRQTDASSTDYEAIGDASVRSKDWKGAAKAYQDAVNLDPASGRLLRKLGEAQYRAGQLDAAQASLQGAADKGQKDALKLLGNIAREQGDVSQANALYQQYLATGPKDAAEVEKILRDMNGG